MLHAASEDLRRSDSAWLTERAAWLDKLALLLEREPGWQQRVRDAVAARPQTVSRDYQQVYDHNAQVLYTALAELLNSRTERQDRHLRDRLYDLRSDLETLVAQGKSTPGTG